MNLKVFICRKKKLIFGNLKKKKKELQAYNQTIESPKKIV